MKKTITLIVLFLLIIVANGQQVTLNEAKEFTNSWLAKKNSINVIDSIKPIKSGDFTILFACILKPTGYILISGEKSFTPIIGYSFLNEFDEIDMPTPLENYLKTYKQKLST